MKRTAAWPAALVVVLAVLAVPACGQRAVTAAHVATKASPAAASPTPLPSGGISRDRAIAIAIEAMHVSADDVESAVVGKIASFSPNLAAYGDKLVWAVTVRGTFYHPCPAPGNCGPAHHQTAFLDYYTGETLVFSERA